MRVRHLSPGFFQNPDLCKLPPHARLLFAGLWCIADREGRLLDRPARIRAELFPNESDTPVADLLAQLTETEEPFIVRYTVDGIRYIHIPKFLEHQWPHRREPQSKLPPPPGWAPTSAPTVPVVPQATAPGDALMQFIAAYPKRGLAHAVAAAFDEAQIDTPTLGAILADIERRKHSEQWREKGGRFIPKPERYLAERQWEDEVMEDDGEHVETDAEYDARRAREIAHTQALVQENIEGRKRQEARREEARAAGKTMAEMRTIRLAARAAAEAGAAS